MKSINHLVLAGRDLLAMRKVYERLGFTLTAPGQHPFGTGNTIIQFHGTYLELLSVTRPRDVVEHAPGEFSFSAFNRDYLDRHEGFSMMVLGTTDAHIDIADWKASGLQTYAPFDFSRQAKMPDGEEVTVGFSLAFVSHPQAPWLGLFACQHFRPQYYEQKPFMNHANSARSVREVWVCGKGAGDLAGYMATVTGSSANPSRAGGARIPTTTGTIIIAGDEEFHQTFGLDPPHPQDGQHLAGLVFGCHDLDRLPKSQVLKHRDRFILPPDQGFGTALAFAASDTP